MLEPVGNTPLNKLYPFLETIICEDTILVGHSLENDLRAMKMVYSNVIDSAVLFVTRSGSKFKLKNLADRILKVRVRLDSVRSKWGSMTQSRTAWPLCTLSEPRSRPTRP